jgi:glycosyltransferase involved in cell wall biosynthesis
VTSPTAAVIPAYQAALTVADVVRGTLARVSDVVVVDDGSDDDTGRVARAAGARVLRHERNLGKGRALRTGFCDLFRRGHERIVTLDADGQHLPEEIGVLARAAVDAHLAVGSRDHLFDRMGVVRRLSNRWSTALIAAVAGLDLADCQSGFRAYTRELIETVGFPEPRFEAERAVIVRAERHGFHVAAVPVRLGFADGRRTSHYRPVVDSLRIFVAVARARFETVGVPVARRAPARSSS